MDGIELEEFDRNWKDRLYVLWNRMSSGSYHPRPVRGVEIPKKNGKKRFLGIPTIEDRVAQMVLWNRLEPLVEPISHEDSYGYRPNKSALDAIATARSRCFRMKWGIEFDIVGLFDNIDHEKLLGLLERHCQEKWVIMYVASCLGALVLRLDKTLKKRKAGTLQGELSVLYWQIFLCTMHLTNGWQINFLTVHGKDMRMLCFGLTIHPEKSKIVFGRRDNEPVPEGNNTSFVFLGYCFRPRLAKSATGIIFMGVTPAVSADAARSFREKVRQAIRKSVATDIVMLSQELNLIIRGWMNYFCRFTPSEAFQKGINYVNQKLVRWIRRCRKTVRRSCRKSLILLNRIALTNPKVFYQWHAGYMPM